MLPKWVAEYVGIPFVPHGRTREGCDCYGLLRLVLSEQFGAVLPMLDTQYEYGNPESEAEVIDGQLEALDFRQRSVPSPGDVVLLRYRGMATHVAVYLGDRRMLHTAPNRGAVVDCVDSPLFNRRILGYYGRGACA